MADLKIYREGDDVVFEAPGSLAVDEEGREIVSFPPDPKIFGNDADGWDSTNAGIRLVVPEVMADVIQSMLGKSPQLDTFIFGHQVQFTSSHECAQMIASHFIDTLTARDVENYIEFRFIHPEHGTVVTTVHRPNGKTPHELRVDAEKSLETSQSELRFSRDRVHELCGKLDAIGFELDGHPTVDPKDRTHKQWSLELAPARRLRDQNAELERKSEETANKLDWWIETSNHNAARANAAEEKLGRVRALLSQVDDFLQLNPGKLSAEALKVIDHADGVEGYLMAMKTLAKQIRDELDTDIVPVDRNVEIRGDWMQTCSGGVFWPLEPKPEDIVLEDVAHALSLTCRFSGHTRVFYSVAQHSVLASMLVPEQDAKWALLHDAAEAYVSDLVRPIKHSPGGEWFRRMEAGIMRCVCDRFGLPYQQPKSVTEADLIMLGTERRDLMCDPPRAWQWVGEPMADEIVPWNATAAEHAFLDRAKELGIE